MNKHIKLILILSIILTFVPKVFAQAHKHGHSDAVTGATPKLEAGEVVVTGTVICLGCSLKKEKGALAQCSVYGHVNALRIEKVIDAQGKQVKEIRGKIYQFLHNDKSDKLIIDHGFAGKKMVVVGKVYPEANILEARFFKEK